MGFYSSSHSLPAHLNSLHLSPSSFPSPAYLEDRALGSSFGVLQQAIYALVYSQRQGREKKSRMRTPMKQEFMRRWTIALETCCKVPSKKMLCAMEKKKMIKQTAAIAMAATKGGSTAWSRAIIADEYDQKNLVKAVMGSQEYPLHLLKLKNSLCTSHSMCKQEMMRKRMMRRSRSRSRSSKAVKASSLAKCIIKKQTRVLKRLMPGGEGMGECCLIGEALDYIVSLKAQVDVMKELVNSMQPST